MNDPEPDQVVVHDVDGGLVLSDVDEVLARLEQEETDLGLEYAGKDKGTNRSQRRASERIIKRVTRRPEACMQLRHPLLDTLTPHGSKALSRRRAKNRVARASRKTNRRAR